MHLHSQSSPLHEIAADWLIVPSWEDEAPAGGIAELDGKLGGIIGRLREQGDAVGKAKELTPIYQPNGIAARRRASRRLRPARQGRFRRDAVGGGGGGADDLRQAGRTRRLRAAAGAEHRLGGASVCGRAFSGFKQRRHSQEQDGPNAARGNRLHLPASRRSLGRQRAAERRSRGERGNWPASWSICRRAIYIPKSLPSVPGKSPTRPAWKCRSSMRSSLPPSA